ncbi:MAG: DNA repair protein RecO [Candidatus Pacebacteria bacterium]|nr:DNA repair protein RecO [Candidatus Paceibacterota bacterium]
MTKKQLLLNAIVLKRTNTGETDRVVTLLTQEQGKVICVAKGVRKLKSSKRAFLEPGNYIKAYLIKTKSLPLLTQAQLIQDFAQSKSSLIRIRKLSQVLEILEKLFVNETIPANLYQELLKLLTHLNQAQVSNRLIKNKLAELIAALGFVHPQQTKHQSILDYVAEISERPVRSFEYLTVS